MSVSQLYEQVSLRRASSYASPRNASDVLPVGYGYQIPSTADKFNGWWIPCINTGSFKYLVVDGISAHTTVYKVWDKDGNAINAANYSFTKDEVDENGAQKAILTMTGDYAAYEPLTCEADGKTIAPTGLSGGDPANPMGAVYDFIVNVAGLGTSLLDLSSLWAAYAKCLQYSYYCHMRVEEDISPADFMAELLASFQIDWWIAATRKVKFHVHPPTRSYNVALAVSDTIAEANTIRLRSRLADVVNLTPADYLYCDYDHVRTDAGTDHDDVMSQATFGTRTNRLNLHTLGSSTRVSESMTTGLGNIQDGVVLRFKDPRILEFTTRDRRFWQLEKDDVFSFSCDYLYDETLAQMRNAAFKVLRLLKRFDKGATEVAALQINGGYMYLPWYAGGNPAPGSEQGCVLANGTRRAGGDPDPNKY